MKTKDVGLYFQVTLCIVAWIHCDTKINHKHETHFPKENVKKF